MTRGEPSDASQNDRNRGFEQVGLWGYGVMGGFGSPRGPTLVPRPTSAPGWNLSVPGPQAQNQKNALNRPNSRGSPGGSPPGIL
jgi:hypothetical protein